MTKEKDKERNDSMLKYIILIVIIIGILMLLWAHFVSTKGLEVKEYKISNINKEFDGLKIVHFSDLHFKSTVNEKDLKNIVKEINKQKPDIVVFTGDLLKDDILLSDKDKETLISELKKIKAKYEIFAVKGNHDYEADYFDQVMKSLNWKVLDNTYEYVYYNSNNPIVFVGFDDYTDGKPDYENAFSYLNEDIKPSYSIVLAHEPDQIDKVIDKNFNIALAGHSHMGQVRFPLVGALWTPYGSKKYVDDYYKLKDNKELYVSNGIGTSSLGIRFLNKPSINLFRFIAK